MFQPLYIAATGLNAFEDEMSDITNNLANSKTVGFKKGRVEKESMFYPEKTFSSHLKQAIGNETDAYIQNTESNRSPIDAGLGVRVVATPKDFSQGVIENTSNSLDIAINGEGFCQVRTPDGSIAYTRAGNFHADNDGNMVDPNGRFLDPQIVFPQGTTSVLIRQDGTVLVSVNNSVSLSEIGQINLSKFTNPSGLKALGQNLFAQTVASGEPIVGLPGQEGFGTIQQSALEQSNVDVVSEMMRMITIQRVFDTITKAVTSYQGMLSSVEKMKG